MIQNFVAHFVFALLVRQLYCTEEEPLVFPLRDAEIIDDRIPQLQLGDSKFQIMRKRVTQPEAHTHCEQASKDGRLAVLPTLEDAFELSQLIYNISDPYTPEYDKVNGSTEWGLDRRYWVGLIDYMEEGKWQWLKTNGMLLDYDFWFPGQPDHNTGRNDRPEHCVTLWNPTYYENDYHTFNDEDCNNKRYFICENIPKEVGPQEERGRGLPPQKRTLMEENKKEVLSEMSPPVIRQMQKDLLEKRKSGSGRGKNAHAHSKTQKVESSENSISDSKEPIKGLSREELSHEEGDPRRGPGEGESSEEL